jgi:hypothetical protein
VLALLEVMKIFFVLLSIINIVWAAAFIASFDVTTAVTKVEVKFIVRQLFLTVVAVLHLFVYFWNIYKLQSY